MLRVSNLIAATAMLAAVAAPVMVASPAQAQRWHGGGWHGGGWHGGGWRGGGWHGGGWHGGRFWPGFGLGVGLGVLGAYGYPYYRPYPYPVAYPYPAYPPPPPAYPRQNQSQGLAIGSMIVGIISLIFGTFCFGPIPGIIALVLGLISLSQVKKGLQPASSKPLAVIGIVTGSLSVAVYGGIMLLAIISSIFS